jgi:hypothetical protein
MDRARKSNFKKYAIQLSGSFKFTSLSLFHLNIILDFLILEIFNVYLKEEIQTWAFINLLKCRQFSTPLFLISNSSSE